MLEALLAILPADKIKRATLTVARGWELSALPPFLALLPAVHTLTVQHTVSGAPCPPWPAEELRAIADALADPTACPCLDTLTFSSPEAGVAERLDVRGIVAARAAAGHSLRRMSVYHVDKAASGGVVGLIVGDAAQVLGGDCTMERAVLARHPVEPLTPGIIWKEHMLEW